MTRYWWDHPVQHPNRYIVRVADDTASTGKVSYVFIANNAADAVGMARDRGYDVIGKAEKVNRAVGETLGFVGRLR